MGGAAPLLSMQPTPLLTRGHRVHLFPVSLTALVPSSSLSQVFSFTQSPSLHSEARVFGNLLMIPTQQDKSPDT